jgi:hypothetical protein
MSTAAPGNYARRNLRLLVYGAAIGFLYGLAFRLAIRFQTETFSSVMLLSFLVFVPLAMGFIPVFVAEIKQPQPIWIWLLLPWLPVAAMVAAAMALFWEGFICVVMFLPLGLIVSTIGGAMGGLTARLVRSRRSRNASLACVVSLPLLIAPWEGHVLYRYDLRSVENVIDIHAPADLVWRNIERVPAIRPDELPSSWSHRIGFPDPVEATLSHEGVGGVRHASFTRGVSFIETVNVWEPYRRLAFSIQIDRIPPTALDEHVRVGGPYFDVLRGEYRLEPLANGVIRLHLSSQHRVSTDFNWYAHLWTDAVLSDFQQRILHVIRQRCENAANKRLP